MRSLFFILRSHLALRTSHLSELRRRDGAWPAGETPAFLLLYVAVVDAPPRKGWFGIPVGLILLVPAIVGVVWSFAEATAS